MLFAPWRWRSWEIYTQFLYFNLSTYIVMLTRWLNIYEGNIQFSFIVKWVRKETKQEDFFILCFFTTHQKKMWKNIQNWRYSGWFACVLCAACLSKLKCADVCIGETSILRHYLAFLHISFGIFSSWLFSMFYSSRDFFFIISLQPSQKFVFDVQKLTTRLDCWMQRFSLDFSTRLALNSKNKRISSFTADEIMPTHQQLAVLLCLNGLFFPRWNSWWIGVKMIVKKEKQERP
jgi:hypothetical protein